MRTKAVLLNLTILLSPLAAAPAAASTPAENSPIAVSPGLPDRFAPVAGRCPTFAWTNAAGATAVELLVYDFDERIEAEPSRLAAPALLVRLPGGATAWTPSLDDCLEYGKRYSWLVRLETASAGAHELSEPRHFMVPATPSATDVRRALQVLTEFLAASGGAEAASRSESAPDSGDTRAPTAGAGGSPIPAALEPFTSALSVEQAANAGAAHGVVGITNSADGAALVADNSAGGADLLIGAAVAAEAAELTEQSLERASANDLTFDFRNSGAGSMTLEVDSTEVLTTATGSATAHDHAGEDVTSGIVAEPRIDAAIARDGEIVPTVLANDGAGSTLDADLLDGSEATAFAPAAGSTSYVAKAGDTMTGALNLPANGLVVGTDQLVASAGRVGIGTAAPAKPFHLQKFLNGAHLIAAIENTGPFGAAALQLDTPAAGNEWNLVAQETGAGAARGFEVQNASFAVPPLAIDASSGFVGIGKLSPTEKLEVAGNAKATKFIGDGSMLTAIDADTVDGVQAVDLAPATGSPNYAPATGSPNYVDKGGDTMTGTLNLPSDGLTVGGAQLSLTGGNLGIGTVPLGGASDPILTMARFLNGAHLVAEIENTGPFSAAGLRLKTPAAGNAWTLAAQETGAGAARGLEVQNPSFATPPLFVSASTGFVGISNLSPADRLDVKGDIRVGTGTTGCVKDADGTLIAGTCSSDARLKKNVVPLSDILDRVTRLAPVHFNWRSDEYPERVLGDETQIGLIAQEVEQVLPELVVEDEDGLRRVRYSELPLLLLQALKEQQEQADSLRHLVRDLAGRLARLEEIQPDV